MTTILDLMQTGFIVVGIIHLARIADYLHRISGTLLWFRMYADKASHGKPGPSGYKGSTYDKQV